MNINRRIVSGNLDVLRFLFPKYKLASTLDEVDSNCIYLGKLEDIDELIKKCDECKYNFIVYSQNPTDFNLDDRLVLANIVFGKYNRLVPKYLMSILDKLDDNTFMLNIKSYWLTGKWLTKNVSEEKSFLYFIDSINGTTLQMYKSYFEVINSINPFVLESSIMTFFLRAKEEDYKDIKGKYRLKLKSFNKSRLTKVIKGIEKSLDYNIDNKSLSLLNMIYNMMINV